MYNVFLSQQWIFDRCLEIEPFFYIATCLIILITGLLWTLILWKTRSLTPFPLQFLIALVPLLPMDLVFLYFAVVSGIFANLYGFIVNGYILVPLIVVVLNVLWYLWVTYIFRTKTKKKKSYSFYTVLFLLTTLLMTPSLLVAAFFLTFFLCRPWSFLKAIDAAHPIHAIIKERFRAGEDMPQNLDDLKTINPDAFTIMTQNARVTYIYNKSKNAYTLFVRPSQHYVAIFDNTNDYGIYKLDQGTFYYDRAARDFPPHYPGPWDQLPK